MVPYVFADSILTMPWGGKGFWLNLLVHILFLFCSLFFVVVVVLRTVDMYISIITSILKLNTKQRV